MPAAQKNQVVVCWIIATRGLSNHWLTVIVKERLLLSYMIDDYIKYKQWTSTTDRGNLEEHKDDFDGFLRKRSSMVF